MDWAFRADLIYTLLVLLVVLLLFPFLDHVVSEKRVASRS